MGKSRIGTLFLLGCGLAAAGSLGAQSAPPAPKMEPGPLIPNPLKNGDVTGPTAVIAESASATMVATAPPRLGSSPDARLSAFLVPAQNGDREAQMHLGELYASGALGKRNDTGARFWLLQVVGVGPVTAGGDPIYRESEAAYARLLLLGRGGPADLTSGIFYSQEAAQGGSAVGAATMSLASLFGWGIAKNYDMARTWAQGAITDDGASPSSVGAGFANVVLGVMALEGWGMPQSYAQAVAYFQTAGSEGNSDGWVKLGEIYEHGLGVAPDGNAAMAWLSKASAQGNPLADFALGTLYHRGMVGPPDLKLAYQYYWRAAIAGIARAEAEVAVYNFKGIGRTPNLPLARNWARRGADDGDTEAAYFLGQIEAAMASGGGQPSQR